MQENSSPHSLKGCGAMLLKNANERSEKTLLLLAFSGQICQGALLVNFIDIFTIWSIIGFV